MMTAEALPTTDPPDTEVWAAFDFDGTLTRRDTLLPFLQFVLGRARLAWVLSRESPTLARYAAGLLDNDTAKIRLLQRAFGGYGRGALVASGERFARSHVAPLLRPDMMARFAQHRRRGHRCVLVTASLGLYTEPWGLTQGFEAVLSSQFTFGSDERPSGRFAPANCYGPEKSRRVAQLLRGARLSYAYGDSRGDRELLAMAEHPVLLDSANGYGSRLAALDGAETAALEMR